MADTSVPVREQPEIAVAAALHGESIAAVTYQLLTVDGGRLEEWDFGSWHLATVGVGLTTVAGAAFSATVIRGGQSFGLQLSTGPLRAGGPTGGVDVSDHPRWAGLLGRPVTAAIRYDRTAQAVPLAVHLATDRAAAWLVAATSQVWPPDGRFHVGVDEAMVAFDLPADIARRLVRKTPGSRGSLTDRPVIGRE